MDKKTLIESYTKEFNVLKIDGNLVDNWSNVVEHCTMQAHAASVIAPKLNLSPEDSNDLIKASILHDWAKRIEREAANKHGYDKYNQAVKWSSDGLRIKAYSEKIIHLTECVGHTSLQKIQNSTSLLDRTMHYLDDITWNNKIVTLDERIDGLEAVPRYKELNESGRSLFDGRTYFEVQREVGKKIESELENIIGEPIVPMLHREMSEIKS